MKDGRAEQPAAPYVAKAPPVRRNVGSIRIIENRG